jgi:hypothetical protein
MGRLSSYSIWIGNSVGLIASLNEMEKIKSFHPAGSRSPIIQFYLIILLTDLYELSVLFIINSCSKHCLILVNDLY